MAGSLRTFLRMPWAEKKAFFEAAFLCARARLMLRRPFREIARRLGQHSWESAKKEQVETDLASVQRVQQGVKIAAKRMPWNCKCYVQAIVARIMLARRGIDGTIYLGVRRGGERGIEAHAWVRSGSQVVTGAEERSTYSIVSVFAFGPETEERPRARWQPRARRSEETRRPFVPPEETALPFPKA